MAINMEKGWSYSIMEIGMKVTIQMENQKDKEIIIGAMAQSIRVSLKMGSDLEQVFGNLVERSMKELT
jgi:GTPase Era involved in 16S rRNA processing